MFQNTVKFVDKFISPAPGIDYNKPNLLIGLAPSDFLSGILQISDNCFVGRRI